MLSGRHRSSVQVAQKRRKELLGSTPGVVSERLLYNTFQTLCNRKRETSAAYVRSGAKSRARAAHPPPPRKILSVVSTTELGSAPAMHVSGEEGNKKARKQGVPHSREAEERWRGDGVCACRGWGPPSLSEGGLFFTTYVE